MKISHIEHLGIAVKSIEEALPYYENVLGLKCYNIETSGRSESKNCFFKKWAKQKLNCWSLLARRVLLLPNSLKTKVQAFTTSHLL